MKTTDNLKPLWSFAIILAAFPVTGVICAVTYHSPPMFYVSLIAVPIAVISFPLAMLLLNVFPLLLLRTVYFIGLRMSGLFSKKPRGDTPA